MWLEPSHYKNFNFLKKREVSVMQLLAITGLRTQQVFAIHQVIPIHLTAFVARLH
jgi:hypothetical protein